VHAEPTASHLRSRERNKAVKSELKTRSKNAIQAIATAIEAIRKMTRKNAKEETRIM
jgi:ribosomal protein S20